MKANPRHLALLLAIPVLFLVGNAAWPAAARAADSKEHPAMTYQCPMHPWVKADQPGRCTICGMDLTPVSRELKGAGAGDGLVVLSSNSITVLNVQAEEVKRRRLIRTLSVAGTLEANETRKAVVAAPGAGRIDALNVAYAGVEVEKGQRLITLFSPDLAQKTSFFRAVAASEPGRTDDLSRVAINPFSGELAAPLSGTVTERPVVLGEYVAEGQKLLTIVDASVLWFRFDVYERQLPWIRAGQSVEVEVPAVPGRIFPAVVSVIEPTINDATRTAKVRADIENPAVAAVGPPQRLLRFGMYAEGRVRAEVPEVLAVPRASILFPGGAAYAYVDRGGGNYERRRLTLGRQGDDFWEVLAGLSEGDRVVTSGNMLIDAQAQFDRGSSPDAAEADTPAAAGQVLVEPGAVQGNATKDSGMSEMAGPHQATGAAGGDNVAPPAGPQPPAAAEKGAPITGDFPPAGPAPTGGQADNGRYRSRRDVASSRRALSEEMRAERWALIAKAHEEEQAAKAKAAAEGRASPDATAAGGAGPAVAAQEPDPASVQAAVAAVKAYREADQARMAVRDEKRLQQSAVFEEAAGQPQAAGVQLTAAQRQALDAFVTAADGVSTALSGDNLQAFNQGATNLPAVLATLQKEFGAAPPWSAWIEPVAKAGQLEAAKDLAEARRQFLPFSAAAVEFAKRLRNADPAFAEIKTYHCPMAPEPGLWMQARGPLKNPFFGPAMLTCGEEVNQ